MIILAKLASRRFCLVPALFIGIFLAAFTDCAAAQVKAAILLNLENGRVLYERNADFQIPPASLAKIMTMYLTMDAVKAKKLAINQKLRIDGQAAATGGSTMGLKAGERVPVVRLLAGMAVASGNDAAMALAARMAGSPQNFARRMNAKARALGMKRTVYKNPTGLPAAGQKTTARDLARLCRTYLKVHPEVKRFHKMAYLLHKGRVLRNTNPLLGSVAGVDGLKTGWTVASGYNLAVTAKRGKVRLLAIVLGCANKAARDSFMRKMLEAGFRHPKNTARVRQAINS